MMRDELALDFVIGALSPRDRAAVTRDRVSDSALDDAIRKLEARFSPMTGLAGTMVPTPGLFDRVVAAIAQERTELAGKLVVACDEGEWQPYLPGIELKQLWSPATVMLRCQPGAVLPAHAHGRTEHIVVLSGDFVVGGRSFGTGDWHSSPAGNAHGAARTVRGCLLLVQLAA